jgi:hypothetical protein
MKEPLVKWFPLLDRHAASVTHSTKDRGQIHLKIIYTDENGVKRIGNTGAPGVAASTSLFNQCNAINRQNQQINERLTCLLAFSCSGTTTDATADATANDATTDDAATDDAATDGNFLARRTLFSTKWLTLFCCRCNHVNILSLFCLEKINFFI